MKRLFVFLGVVYLFVATQATAQRINDLKPLENSKSLDIESVRNYFNDNNIRVLDNTGDNIINGIRVDKYPLIQSTDTTSHIIHGKRGPSNSVTIHPSITPNNRPLRDTFEHPNDPKTRLKIEPTPEVVKPDIIPLESR